MIIRTSTKAKFKTATDKILTLKKKKGNKFSSFKLERNKIKIFEDILISVMEEIGRFQVVKAGNEKTKGDFVLTGSITKRESVKERKRSIEVSVNLESSNDSIHIEEKKENLALSAWD